MIVIFTFFCVMVVTAVLFGGWVIMSIIKLVARAFTGPGDGIITSSSSRTCGNPGCRTVNPLHANYCRRCGANLANPMVNGHQPLQPRQAQFNPSNGNSRAVAGA